MCQRKLQHREPSVTLEPLNKFVEAHSYHFTLLNLLNGISTDTDDSDLVANIDDTVDSDLVADADPGAFIRMPARLQVQIRSKMKFSRRHWAQVFTLI